MAEQPSYPATDEDTGVPPGRGPGRPRWVSVVGIAIAIAVVLVVVVLHLTGVIGPGAH